MAIAEVSITNLVCRNSALPQLKLQVRQIHLSGVPTVAEGTRQITSSNPCHLLLERSRLGDEGQISERAVRKPFLYLL